MIFFILAYLGGALTILAPCILPVVPFVFARVDQPFTKGALPLLAGMALTFAGIASLGAAAGSWAVQLNEYGRMAAVGVLAVAGVMLVLPSVAERLTRPLVAFGSRLANASTQRGGSLQASGPAATSFLLGMATGLLWAPCAGPVLGLILTGAALQGPSVQTSLLLLAYAAGAASSLGLVLLVGQRMVSGLRRSLGSGVEWLRRGLGVAVLAGVGAVALGLDTGALADLSQGGGNALERTLLDKLRPPPAADADRMTSADESSVAGSSPFITVQARSPMLDLPVEGTMPPISGAIEWLNSPPLSAEQLRGKVVLIDFWTFGCINCRNALPYVREWQRKYKDEGLVVIGVHSPEFAYEKKIDNVRRAAADLGVTFPVAIDNNFTIWRAFANNYWPAHYFVDAQGRIRFHHFGEGEYAKSEQVIQQLLQEARKDSKPI